MTEQVDMSQFIAAKSDQLNADDLMDSPKTITITRVTAQPDAADQPVSIHYEGGEGRPFKPCKTMRRVMTGVWGKYTDKYIGQSMTLYRDNEVQFGGMKVGGIRISHMSGISEPKTLALLVTRGRKAPYKVLPLVTKVQPADEQSVALKAITDAAEQGTEALANVWKQKWMAPHREALQLDLDRLKSVAAANDPAQAESEKPVAEPAQGTLADQLADTPAERADALIAEITQAISVLDINGIMARDMDGIPDELIVKIEVAADQRKHAINQQRAKAPKDEVEG